jgi:hypothetical protein
VFTGEEYFVDTDDEVADEVNPEHELTWHYEDIPCNQVNFTEHDPEIELIISFAKLVIFACGLIEAQIRNETGVKGADQCLNPGNSDENIENIQVALTAVDKFVVLVDLRGELLTNYRREQKFKHVLDQNRN